MRRALALRAAPRARASSKKRSSLNTRRMRPNLKIQSSRPLAYARSLTGLIDLAAVLFFAVPQLDSGLGLTARWSR